MSTTADRQVNRQSPRAKAMRDIHQAAAERGFDHAELRRMLGVESLTQLSDKQLHDYARHLRRNRPERWRLTTGATKAQRAYIWRLGELLEWTELKLARWLRRRLDIDLAAVDVEPEAARSAIDQLQNAARKLAAERGWRLEFRGNGFEVDKHGADPAAAEHEEVPF